MIFLLEPLNGHEEVLKDDSRCDQSIRSGEFCPDTNFEDNPTTLKRSRANLDLCHAWGVVMVPLKKNITISSNEFSEILHIFEIVNS